jgi:hypothetical protein
MRCVVDTPELLTRMSMEPISVSAWATAALMEARSVTSHSTTWASPPSPSMRARKSLSFSMPAAGQHHAGAGARQRARELRAQAARGAGDQGHAAGQINAVAHGKFSMDGQK